MRALTCLVLGTGWLCSITAMAELTMPVDPPAPSRRIVEPPPPKTARPVSPPTPTQGTLPTIPAPMGVAGCRLVVTLSDGSRLIGRTKLKQVTLESATLGTLNVGLANIREITLAKDNHAALTLQNGDRMQVRLRLEQLDLQTVFGDVIVPVQHMTVVQVRLEQSESRPIDWELLPIPRNANWGGHPGEAARLEDGALVLRGWHARTAESYTLPITFECEVVLDEAVANDGCLWVNFAPADEPRDMLPRNGYRVVLGYGADGRQKLSVEEGDGRDYQLRVLENKETGIEGGKAHRLRIEWQATGLRVTLDGKTFDVADAKLPAEKVRIYVRGWQPLNCWRVKDARVP